MVRFGIKLRKRTVKIAIDGMGHTIKEVTENWKSIWPTYPLREGDLVAFAKIRNIK